MLTADVRFAGFTTTDWTRVLSLFRPRKVSGGERDEDRPRGGVVAIQEGGRLRKLIHTEAGRLRLEDMAQGWPMSCEELVARSAASWGLIVEAGALETIMDGFGARARRTDDLMVQTLSLAQLLQAEFHKGRLDLYPGRLRGVPIPSPGVVHASFDAICPVGRAMVLGLFDAGELWTSIALRRRVDGIDLILGPDEIRADMGLLAGDFRRDHRHLARAIEARVGPIALGCYSETSTIRALEVDPSPGSWARAVASRDVILSPIPAALAVPIGIDAGRAALSALRDVVDRFDPLGIIGPSLDKLKSAAAARLPGAAHDGSDAPGGRGHAWGFDPLEMLRRILSRDR